MSEYETFNALMASLPTDRRVDVARLQSQAMAYVWGREDAGEARRGDNASWDFCYAYGAHAAEYALERRGSRWSIRHAWDVWSTGGTIGVYPGEHS